MPDVITIVTAVLVVAMLAATKRCVSRIRRRATIKASAQNIFPPIGDLRDLASWSPRPKAAEFTMLPQGGATQLDREMYGSSSSYR